jgi:hypothetical protein
MEYRVMANLAQEKVLLDQLQQGVDFHTATASMMLSKAIETISKDDRQIGKRINFGLVYGLTDNGLARNLGVTRDEAVKLRSTYFSRLPKAGAFIEATKQSVVQSGMIRTMSGRIRRFDAQLKKAREKGDNYGVEQAGKQGFNTLCQGGAADMAKLAIWRVYEMIKPYGDKIRMLMQIHDAIEFEVHESIPKEEFFQLVEAAMSYRGVVPGWADIPVDVEFGTNFGNCTNARKHGLAVDLLMKDNPFLAQVPDCSWFFDPIIRGDNSIKAFTPPPKSSAPKTFVTRQSAQQKPPAPKPTTPAPEIKSKGKEMAEKMETKNQPQTHQRIDLSKATFPVPTIVIFRLEEVSDDDAYTRLKTHISDNYGECDLILESEGLLFKFPAEYKIGRDYSGLEAAFEIQFFDGRPQIKLSL